MALIDSGINEGIDELQSLLSPVSAEEFLRNDWGERFVRVDGDPDRFSPLFSWQILNAVLESYPLCPPRMTLCRSGEEIEHSRFVASHMLAKRGTSAWLKGTDLMAELKNGATLVLNYAEELSEPLRRLAAKLESLFHSHITVNLYAAFRNDNGLSLHWDDQDTLILQVIGCKRWVVYEPTRIHPVKEDPRPVPRPTAPPVWDGIVSQGGLLHVPRGWPHVTYPMDQPSLHLTVTVKCATGLDFLRWIVGRLCDSAEVRANLPLWGNSESRTLRLASLKEKLLKEWGYASIDRFVEEADADRMPRPRLTLPDFARH